MKKVNPFLGILVAGLALAVIILAIFFSLFRFASLKAEGSKEQQALALVSRVLNLKLSNPLSAQAPQAQPVVQTAFARTPTAIPLPTQNNAAAAAIPAAPTPIPTPTPNPYAEEYERVARSVQVEWDSLYSVNPDLRAWIQIDAAQIDQPVLASPDNEYYLKVAFDGSYHEMGSIYFDFRNHTDFRDPNIIIYGHNFDNGRMFSNLVWFRQQAFVDANPSYYILTPRVIYRVDIASGFLVENDDATYLSVEFPAEDGYAGYLASIKARSEFQTDVALTDQDRIVTLYTCTNNARDQRFVLVGKLTEIGRNEQAWSFPQQQP